MWPDRSSKLRSCRNYKRDQINSPVKSSQPQSNTRPRIIYLHHPRKTHLLVEGGATAGQRQLPCRPSLIGMLGRGGGADRTRDRSSRGALHWSNRAAQRVCDMRRRYTERNCVRGYTPAPVWGTGGKLLAPSSLSATVVACMLSVSKGGSERWTAALRGRRMEIVVRWVKETNAPIFPFS